MAERYNSGQNRPVLPALMLFYIWNIYGNSKERPELIAPFLDIIERKLRKTLTGDDRYVLLLLKGVCLRNHRKPDEAIECFVEIVRNQDLIEVDTYLAPHACLELGLTYLHLSKLGK